MTDVEPLADERVGRGTYVDDGRKLMGEMHALEHRCGSSRRRATRTG